MTALDLLKSALTRLGKNVAPTTSTLALTGYTLLSAAVSMAGRNVAIISDYTITVTSLLNEAYYLLGVDTSDTTTATPIVISSINRMLADLFETNNSILAANGSPPITPTFLPGHTFPAVTAISDTIPYQYELVHNVMAYGLARDVGISMDNQNVAYCAEMYDSNKARYTICQNGRTEKTTLASLNRMFGDLYAINNMILQLNNLPALSAIPNATALSANITYQDELTLNVMVYGLAHDLGLDDRDNTYAAMYEQRKAKYTVYSAGDLLNATVFSVNEMLYDLFGINNDLLVAAGSAALTSVPEITALSTVLTYQPGLTMRVMPLGLARDLAAGEGNKNLMYFAGMYDKAKAAASIFVSTDITDEYADDSDD